MPYSDLDDIHRPANGLVAPYQWGDQVNDNIKYLYTLMGLTGTTGRFVGVSNGAPASGTYNTNDFTIDPTNLAIWVCTAGGTPGTWTGLLGAAGDSAIGGLVTEVAFPASTQSVTSSGSNVNLSTGLTFAFPVVNGHKYKVEINGQMGITGGTASYMNMAISSVTDGNIDLPSGIYLASSNQVPTNEQFAFGAGRLMTATTTGTATVALTATLSAGSGVTLTIVADAISAVVTRVA